MVLKKITSALERGDDLLGIVGIAFMFVLSALDVAGFSCFAVSTPPS